MDAREAYSLKLMSQPTIYDKKAYFTLTWIDGSEYRSSIYSFDGKNSERMTFGGRESSPKFINDDLYYIRSDENTDHLMVLRRYSEPTEIFSYHKILKYVPYLDGIIAIVEDDPGKSTMFITDRLKYRFDTRGLIWKKRKLVYFDGTFHDLVSGNFDVTDIETEGKRIIFSSTQTDDDTGLEDVYVLQDGKIEKLTEGQGSISAVSIGDGKIAYAGHRKGLWPPAVSNLMFPEEGKEIPIGKGIGNILLDHFVEPPVKLKYSKRFYTIALDGGKSAIYSYTNAVKKETDIEGTIVDFDVSENEMAYIYTNFEKPSILSFRGGEFDPNNVKGITADKNEVDGLDYWSIITDKNNPTILFVHGGPHASYGNAYYIEFNYLASNGFNVIFGNPHGSGGYGEDFAASVIGDWGGKDYEELISFVRDAKDKYGLFDNFHVTGGSYGGYMTNHIVTKTDLFRSAVSERSISNFLSMCGTSDIGFWFNAIENAVKDPWISENQITLMKMSPIYHVKRVKTPILFIHGENDSRCPIEQAEQFYTALKINGVETKLVRSIGDSHEHARKGNPENMRKRLELKLEWFKSHSK
ncbi:hypothetical protein [Thermoplasma volcanium GSS1]|uniref:Peptidase S9 prolyl oligopeptidase catalytic domain-containing protein n=1 Tax=Thermoplasma volcanium (strain ATCC 51530 / DSM 4299 / JCM 9571 / NBRC 15438 / GSS1) TaxID=273116 RepID=Q97AA2_THEVO|nr:S9 family peptidase [Thermoplasma volcanium]BAB60050.1 hypothetical protein [Thermoplasma volcanium GSS1]